jgi:hypothetical protein
MSQETPPPTGISPWISIIIGLIFGIVAIVTSTWFYQQLAQAEAEGGSTFMPSILVFLYDLGGKELVSGTFLVIFGLFAILGFIEGIQGLLRKRRGSK